MCVVKEFCYGDVVNLGIGIFILVVNYILFDVYVFLYLENGIFGVGFIFEEDYIDSEFVNVGKLFVMVLEGVLFFNSVDFFVMIWGGYVNVLIFGVF